MPPTDFVTRESTSHRVIHESVSVSDWVTRGSDAPRIIWESIGHPIDQVTWRQTRAVPGGTAVLNERNEIELSMSGPSPKNEEDALEVCERLVWALNERGGSWSAVEPGSADGDVDAWAPDLANAGRKIEMQVVRASPNARWKELAATGVVDEKLDCDTAADELFAAIEKKGEHYADAQRRRLTLVIDVSRVPSHTFEAVFRAFRACHEDEARAYGFAAIWVVGGKDVLVSKLLED